ncbi:MAG: very short patch repair endonuclease [Candidatus Accumulibacter propinquus]
MSAFSPRHRRPVAAWRRCGRKGTNVEVALRRELHRSGLRYRVDFDVLKKPRRVADVAFPGLRIAIFVDGCFWHGCPQHATWPKHNAEFWREKIEANRMKDADTNSRLHSIGWTVLRFWEHESPIEAAKTVAQTVAMARSKRRVSPAVPSKNN